MNENQKLTAPLWVRITPRNRDWVDKEAKRLGYSRSQFLNLALDEYRMLVITGQNKRDRKKK